MEEIRIWEREEYHYPLAGEFIPNLHTYLHGDGKTRPAMLVVPGGGYAMVSPTEGEIVAKRFYDEGYQAFVLTYTTNVLCLHPLETQPLADISRAVRLLRARAEEFCLDPQRLACCGFSAGGHLVGSLAVHWKEQAPAAGWEKGIPNRPDGVILSYPVITSGEKAHRDSFVFLLGKNAPEEKLRWASLETQVTADAPPAFLWHTITDGLVPVENSLLYMEACRQTGVPCELHLFQEGHHGMSLANKDWAAGRFGASSSYAMEQHWQTLKALHRQCPERIPAPFAQAARSETLAEFAAAWEKGLHGDGAARKAKADAGISQWPSLAAAWLNRIFA